MNIVKSFPVAVFCGMTLCKKQQGKKSIAGTLCSMGVLKDQSCPWGLVIEKCFFLLFSGKPWPLYLLADPNKMILAPIIIGTVKSKVHFLFSWLSDVNSVSWG